ncbi:benzoylformate decarboxylase [Actinoallomurus bryophytorum]|uniref:Benzoylformate decarboxylase n=1 Tax=Actinoallomurus bryophytorum TaxID=1490222 RepID=A0A543CSL7_9ACTN|nr:thiamine pyrophosphate-binding protein [Actinoallomurus bryophytorum]TQM00001.1 benzoylformate decarboxylase [Actinoallomurus bryophytorum]
MTGPGRSGGRAVLETLRAWGVRRVFTCPGSTEAAFLDATLDHPDFEVILTPHESIAVSAADGYARATGEPAVAYLHTHVGLANSLGHLNAARLAHSPVVVLTGLKPALLQAHGGFTCIQDTGRLAEPYVRSYWQSLRTEGIPEDLTRAFRLALTEPAGPTWLGLSQDLMNDTCTAPVPDPERFRPRARTAPDPERIREVAGMLATATSPLLVAGAEVARHDAVADLIALAERLGVPVMNEDRRTYERPGFPTSHPNYVGLYDVKRPVVGDSDLIVFAGCRLFTEFEVPRGPDVPESARVVHIHTDAAEIGAIHGVDLDIVADEGLALSGLLAGLPEGDVAVRTDRVAEARTEYLADTGPLPPETEGVENVAAVADALAAVVDDQTTVVGDATTTGAILLRRLPQNPPHQYFTSSSGSLGWAMGAAIGIKLAMPDRHVVAVLGDGAFQFGPQGLWVAARYQIPVTYVVINNESYAAVAAALRRYGGTAVERQEFPGKDLSGIDVAAIARGYGVHAQRLHHASELGEAMAKAKAHPGPSLIEIMTDPDYLGP